MLEDSDPLSYFSGGVPPGALFQLSAWEIKKMLDTKPKAAIGNTSEEVCFIGIVSYFEAFCKDCFSSAINICPELVTRLQSHGFDTQIDSVSIIEWRDSLSKRLGFILAEKYDFGTAKRINGLYRALLNRTPFSKGEIKTYDKILSDRNLLVHHGGIITSSYFRQQLGISSERERMYFDSLRVDKEYVEERFEFLHGMARKMVAMSDKALSDQANAGEIHIGDEEAQALYMFGMWDDDRNG